MRWPKGKSRQDASVNDPEVVEMLQEITDRLTATSSQLKSFSADLQANINTLRRYAANVEREVREKK